MDSARVDDAMTVVIAEEALSVSRAVVVPLVLNDEGLEVAVKGGLTEEMGPR